MITIKNSYNLGEQYPKLPNGYDSWLEYWESNCSFAPLLTKCACKGCTGKKEIGALVMKLESSEDRRYIIPLCQSCASKTDEFQVVEYYLIHTN